MGTLINTMDKHSVNTWQKQLLPAGVTLRHVTYGKLLDEVEIKKHRRHIGPYARKESTSRMFYLETFLH